MKRARKIILITLLILVIAVGAVAVWQRKNIEGVYIGINSTSEEIKQRRDSNQTSLVKEIDSVLQEPLREPTQEEKSQIEDGIIQLADVYAKIFEERNLQIETEKQNVQSQGNVPSKMQTSVPDKPTRDEIITKYMAQLYKLQSEFTARAEATISQGDRYYESLKKSQDKATARANTITYFTPIVRGVEAECDGKVEEVIQNLKKELEGIGANTDITGTIRATYANEKQLKLAYYANKYLK